MYVCTFQVLLGKVAKVAKVLHRVALQEVTELPPFLPFWISPHILWLIL